MNTPTERIHSLIPFLPKKDIVLGYKFLEKRDFESLAELVDSALFKIKNNIKKENPKKEYLDIDLAAINELKVEVDLYALENLAFYNIKEDLDEY